MFNTILNATIAFGATWLVSKTNTKLGAVANDILNVGGKSLDLVSAATHSISQSVDEISSELSLDSSRASELTTQTKPTKKA